MTTLPRAGRVPLSATAFSHDLGLRRKRPRIENAAHLAFIRGLPCLICGTRQRVEAAHIRAGSAVYGKRRTGLGEKPADRFTLPLCGTHHADQHRGNELAFWSALGIDPFAVALALWSATTDEEAAEMVINLNRPTLLKLTEARK